MKKQTLSRKKIWSFLQYAAALALLLGGEIAYIHHKGTEQLDAQKLNEANTVSQGAIVMSDWVTQGLEVIAFLSNDSRVVAYIDEHTDLQRLQVKQLFGNVSYATALYDQIRILDLNGMEVVRVNYDEEFVSPLVVPDAELQDKSGRDYFQICRDLPKGGIYISRLELNIENSQVEEPYKPVVRICGPLTDSNGEKQGILILNAKAIETLQKFSAISDKLMLVNDEGYWLVSHDLNDEWAFMFEHDASLPKRYPQTWDTLISSDEGQFSDENGLWTYRTIYPLEDALKRNTHIWNETYLKKIMMEEAPKYYWKAISFIPEADLQKERQHVATPIILGSIPLYPLVVVGIWQFKQRRLLKNQETERIRYQATHDGITGLFNKAFFEAELSRLNHGRAYPISMVVIDANNLKKVNDTYGHSAGDTLLKNISQLILQNFRKNDVLARLGGDEFVLMLPVTQAKDCRMVLKRFRANIKKFNAGRGSLQVDVAIGSATTQGDEDLNAVLERADQAMYAEKSKMKAGR